jgi:hypothetical protein
MWLLIIAIIVVAILVYLIIPVPLVESITGHTAKAMLLTCMDYRFSERIGLFMASKDLTNQYDHFILAGASLGMSSELDPMVEPWRRTWFEHLDLAVQLHKISSVIIIDHEDCGAYRELLGFDHETEDMDNPNIIPMAEVDIHSKYLREAYTKIRQRYPTLTIELYMIGLKQNTISIPVS